MKRIGDNVNAAESQSNSPLGSPRNESHGESIGDGSGSGSETMSSSEAFAYIKEVKDTFHDQRDKYEKFLDVMHDFKTQRIDNTDVIAQVKELFKGHNNLIIGFNAFLPPGHEINVDDEEEESSSITRE